MARVTVVVEPVDSEFAVTHCITLAFVRLAQFHPFHGGIDF